MLVIVMVISVYLFNNQSNLDLISETYPVKDYPTREVISEYGLQWNEVFGKERMYPGITLAGTKGEEVYSIKSGTVAFTNNLGGYGECIMIDHGDNETSLYGHLSEHKVKIDDEIEAGQVIGLIGDSGYTSETCLEFEVRKDGKHVDPKEYMKNLTTTGGR